MILGYTIVVVTPIKGPSPGMGKSFEINKISKKIRSGEIPNGVKVIDVAGRQEGSVPSVVDRPSLKETAEKIISMSLKTKAENREQKREYNISKGRAADNTFFGAEDLFAMYESETPTPMRDALLAFLNSLDEENLESLVALMYAGRGDDDYNDMKEYARGWGRERCVMTLIGKAPLAKYLQKGLANL